MSGDYERVRIPAESWHQLERRIRMLESLDSQQRVILESLVETLHATVVEDETAEQDPREEEKR